MKNRLLRLLSDNRAVKGARRFEILNAGADEATVYLYDTIVSSAIEAEYWGGVAAEQFVRDFNAIAAPVIHLRINSPGGDVFAARAMEQAVRAHASKVIVHIDGYAASAATFLAMAGDEIEIVDGGFFMIHNSWSIAMGNADDFEHTAGVLRQVDETIIATYRKRMKDASGTDLVAMMKNETWIGAQEAVDLGFADRITQSDVKDRVDWNITALVHGNRTRKNESVQTSAPDAELIASRARAERLQNHVERIAA